MRTTILKIPLFIFGCLIIHNCNAQVFDGDTTIINTSQGKVSKIDPVYPGGITTFLSELKTGIESNYKGNIPNCTIEISFEINEFGKIENSNVVRSGGKKLDKAVIKTLYELRTFEPCKIDGKSVSFSAAIPIAFN